MKHILVICIGNICRSPMGEALLRNALPDKVVCSAGLGALIGQPADPFSLKLMSERGIDISEHRAQQISTSQVLQADLILVMDQEQKKHVETKYPSARGKVFCLGNGEKVDIPDPYREGIESFRLALRLIDDGVQFWAEQIKKIS